MKRPVRKEKPFPVVGVVVAVVCMGAVVAAWYFIKPSERAKAAARRGRRKRETRIVPGTPAAERPGIGAEPAFAAPEPRREVSAPRTVQLSPVAPGDKSEDWKLIPRCPKCRQEVGWMARTCSCGQALKWPEQLSCPFCGGGGKCPVCKGEEAVCKHCKGRSKRTMMGIVLEKCGYCDGTGKCGACKGTGKCPKCEGTGKIVPAKMSP